MRRQWWLIPCAFLVASFVGCSGCGEDQRQFDKDTRSSGDVLADGDGALDGGDDAVVDGSSSDATGDDTSGDDAGGDATGEDAGDGDTGAIDASDVRTDVPDGTDGGPGDTADGTAVDAVDASDGGTTDPCAQCTSEQICNNGTCECPNYHKLCGGSCVAVNLNPDHCGDCNNQCASDEVCNLGNCTTDCPPEMEECNGRCVDTDINDDHCGTCGNSCASDKACSFGSCVDTVPVDSSNKTCKGGGPPVNIDFGTRKARKKCSGSLAKNVFRWGICTCDGLNMKNNLYIDAFDSQLGPHQPGGYGGSLGSNGPLSIGKGEVFGSIWSSYDDASTPSLSCPTQSARELYIKQQLRSDGDVEYGKSGSVDGNAWIGGDLTKGGTGGGQIPFRKNVYIPQGNTVGGGIDANNVVRQPVDVSTVCERCQKDQQIPVADIVDKRKNNNDNSVINLQKDALDQPGQDTVLKLPCGEYYLTNIDVSNKLVITTSGRTALFIDGNVKSTDQIKVVPSSQGELDVFVNGKVNLANDIQIGATGYPASTRFYVNDDWTLQNDATLGAYIYAVPGGISLMNNLVMYGGLYTQNLQTMNNVDIHYDRAVLEADKKCPDPDDDNGGGGGMDAGMGDGGIDDGGTGDSGSPSDGSLSDGSSSDGSSSDGSSSDGGTPQDSGSQDSSTVDANDSGTTCKQSGGSCSVDSDCCSPLICGSDGTCQETCNSSGEACSTDSDCCSPLICGSDGTCQTSDCKNLYESCSSDGDCCSGNCATSTSDPVCVAG